MCGVGGVIGEPLNDEVLLNMAHAMTHRGPDGQGIWRDARAGLVFRRLAIIDLDERSMQPYNGRLVENDIRAGRWRDPRGIRRLLNLELWLGTFDRSSAGQL